MAFVNEYVPIEDEMKYGLEEIDKQYLKAFVSGRCSWTIDRERDIYLRWMKVGREEFSNQHVFTFYWEEHLFRVILNRKGGGVRGGKGWSNWTLVNFYLPNELEQSRPLIYEVLKEALAQWGEFGVRSSVVEHTATFEF